MSSLRKVKIFENYNYEKNRKKCCNDFKLYYQINIFFKKRTVKILHAYLVIIGSPKI